LAETRNVRCLAPLSSATARYMQCAVPPSRARLLIPVLAQPIDSGSASALQGLDAIFIPTRDRPANVAALLEQIAWFDGPIYILPSGSRRSRCDRSGRLTVLQPDYDSLDLFRHLRTSRHTQTAHYFGWDLFNPVTFAKLSRTGRLHLTPTFPIGLRLVEEMRVIRPDLAIREVTQPLLAIHGDADSMVPFDVSKTVLRGLPNAKFVPISNMDHGFTDADDDLGQGEKSLRNKITIYDLIVGSCL
jgi:pimeloyl-ACP methyl ester carboxylesterase